MALEVRPANMTRITTPELAQAYIDEMVISAQEVSVQAE